MSATYNFTLTLTISGDKLEDIDSALAAAAGERLRARMLTPPKLNGVDVLAVNMMPPAPITREEPQSNGAVVAGAVGGGSAGHDNVAAASDVEAVQPAKKRGRPAGWRKNPAPEGAVAAPAESVQGAEDNSAELFGSQPHEGVAPAREAASAAEIAPAGKAYTLQDAVAALTGVNTKKDSDTAWGCLVKFGVKRCGELTDLNRGAFVSHCNTVAAG